MLGELLWAHESADINRVEAHVHRALDEARRQQVRFLELRAATTLARLYRDTSRIDEAIELLGASRNLFPADTELTDLAVARALLDEISRM